MRGRRDSDAHVSVLETVIVGVIMLGSIAYFVQVSEPRSDEAGATARVETFSRDALTVLAGLPSTDGSYASLLDELVDEAYDGNPARLEERLDRYFPPGISYNVYLSDGYDLTPLVETYQPTGPAVSVTRLVNKVDSLYLLFPQVANLAGLNDTEKVRFYGIPLRNGFYYPHLPSSLEFENGHRVTFTTASHKDVLVADNVPPDLVAAPEGFATQYDKSSDVSFAASVTNATVAKAVQFSLDTDTDATVQGHPFYHVHPAHVIPATLVDTLNTGDFMETSADKKNAKRGGTVHVTRNYGFLGLSDWVVGETKTHIYNPRTGLIMHTVKDGGLVATEAYQIPDDAPYGTYVVEFQATLVKGTSTQIVRDFTLFNVMPMATATALPPVYRLELVAWFEGA